jgi:hypothetical protein
MLLCYGPQDGLVWSYSKGIFPYHEKQTVVMKDVESALQKMLQGILFLLLLLLLLFLV